MSDIKSSPDPLEIEWLAALRGGDERALRQLFDRYYPRLITDIYRLIPDEDTCQDLAQDVFVELWRKRAELDIHSSPRAYLRRAAINRALNFIKTQRRYVLDTGDELSRTTPDTSAQDIDQKEKQDSLEAALHVAVDALPEKCRVVFSLSRFEHRSHREIAEQLGISVKTIENQITKALRLLREALTRHADLSPVVIWALKWWWGG